MKSSFDPKLSKPEEMSSQELAVLRAPRQAGRCEREIARVTADGWPTSPRKSFEDFEDGFREFPADSLQGPAAVRACPPKRIPEEEGELRGGFPRGDLADLQEVANGWGLVKSQAGHRGSSSEEEKAVPGERVFSMGLSSSPWPSP